jgi:hypothetical protein
MSGIRAELLLRLGQLTESLLEAGLLLSVAPEFGALELRIGRGGLELSPELGDREAVEVALHLPLADVEVDRARHASADLGDRALEDVVDEAVKASEPMTSRVSSV